MSFLNIDSAQVGGIRFLKLGRITIAFSLSRHFRPIGAAPGWRYGE